MITVVKDYLVGLQQDIVNAFTKVDKKKFVCDDWRKDQKSVISGYGKTCVLRDGNIFESVGVNFSLVNGDKLPVTAATRANLKDKKFFAVGVSVVAHPKNPFIPTSHMNVRFFIADNNIWWFGGGYDLTPYYGFDEDCKHWHTVAFNACKPFGPNVYNKYKKWCDDYFYLPHRNEPRGIGGIFFDDLNNWSFDQCFIFLKSVGDSYLPAYLPIVDKRKNNKYTEKHRRFQLYRRGRYVEFNLIYDRGTIFGLKTKGRVESILMSMPPVVNFSYNYNIAKNSDEEKLYTRYLINRDWI